MILLKTDGTVEPMPDKSLSAMQKAVGGYIEIVGLPDGRMIVIDEEGKYKDYQINEKATELTKGLLHEFDVIVGDAILAEKGEIE